MKSFFYNLYCSFFDAYKSSKKIYVLSIVLISIGIVLGIVLSFVYSDLQFLLSLSNKNYTAFLKGEAGLSSIFLSSFKWIIIATLFCTIFSLFKGGIIFSLLYLSYQSSIMMMTIFSLIKLFGLAGILNSVFFVLPFNLVIILLIAWYAITLYSHFIKNKRLGYKLFSCQTDKFVYFRTVSIILCECVICLILAYVVPCLLKSLIIVSF